MRKRIAPRLQVLTAIVNAAVKHINEFGLQRYIVQLADTQCALKLLGIHVVLRMCPEELSQFGLLPVLEARPHASSNELPKSVFAESCSECRAE
jgi:hypothetical protein